LKDVTFEAAARYNLGNCNYADALTAFQAQDAQTAVAQLDRAQQEYRDALRLDPQRQDARANLELAAQLKKQIEEMAQQQPQSRPSSQPSQQDQQQQQQDQSTSQPSSQPSESEQRDQTEPSEEQQQEPPQQPTSQPETQPAPETQPSAPPQAEPSQEEEQLEEERQPPVPIEMTREEAERLLQMIRDLERQRRAMLRAREAAGQKPVDKDW